MTRREKKVRVLARLYKTPPRDGAYYLRGHLPDGREVWLVANQRKRRREDADYLLLEVLGGEAVTRPQGGEE